MVVVGLGVGGASRGCNVTDKEVRLRLRVGCMIRF